MRAYYMSGSWSGVTATIGITSVSRIKASENSITTAYNQYHEQFEFFTNGATDINAYVNDDERVRMTHKRKSRMPNHLRLSPKDSNQCTYMNLQPIVRYVG